MVAFHDTRLPEVIEQGAEGGPIYSTSVVESLGGYEQRNGNWAQPRFKWNITSGWSDETTYQALLTFFHARAGRLYGFRFKDWSNYQAVAQPQVAATGGRQLYVNYTSGGYTLQRKITRPVSGTVTLSAGGTLDYATGLVTGGSAGTWTGEFDVPVRFDADEFSMTLEQVDIGSARLDVVSLRE